MNKEEQLLLAAVDLLRSERDGRKEDAMHAAEAFEWAVAQYTGIDVTPHGWQAKLPCRRHILMTYEPIKRMTV